MSVLKHASIFGCAAVLALSLVGCSSEEAAPSTPTTMETTTTPPEKLPGVGEPVEAEGVTLAVLEVSETATLPLLEDGVKAETAATETRSAESGTKFVSVVTEVENTGTESWDLTCGFAVQASLFDPDDRRFDPVEDLYRIPGNPECNDHLNPGMKDQMTWVFEVPETIKAEKFGFADPETHYDDFTFIDLTTVTGDLTPTSEVPAQEPTEAATTETSASIAAEPESSEPTFVRCLADLTIYALYSDGSTRITPSCENDPAVQRAARAEGVCGGLYAPEGTTAEEYLDLCGVPIRTSPPSAPESVAPVSPVAPEPANGNTPGQ
ncbi:DUF4352 domain-containing protein [Corynebacterium doosanense]|uniref:DUF4352 domain-containing protein n=1 Tax=Corynebacterium doosanense CAU 212 = DSM 45436 TaxID=558173 RepID=A0A097IJN6_9CORY|nr:DUF4352 domain-containing protein [Corynebacterium doosanense]AIT62325.1 hypothetical protein CDOO_11510 [Corynebacterium doosanense CAU 212 = DSM 45436]